MEIRAEPIGRVQELARSRVRWHSLYRVDERICLRRVAHGIAEVAVRDGRGGIFLARDSLGRFDLVRIERHSKLFWGAFAFWSPVYWIAYWVSPPDLCFLPRAWLAHPTWLDFTYGYVVFALNCHGLLDFFFTVNGGFSTCLLAEIYKAGPRGLSTADMIDMFVDTKDGDKIYAWRLPRLVETGYLRMDQDCESVSYCLTKKGQFAAHCAQACKRVLNLGRGG